MKTIKTIILGATLLFNTVVFGQNEIKETCTVLDIQVKGDGMINSGEAGNLTRHLMNKLNIYTISYDQDINYVLNEETSKAPESKLSYSCYSIQCLEKIGKLLKTDKMLSGYVERTRENVIISFREFDVKSGKITRSKSREYKNIPEQLKNMILITLQDMYLFDKDKQLDDYLTKLESRESPVNNPNVKRLNLSGVRMGVVHIFGENGDRLKESETVGGFDASSTLFQFGYQFERQYLNQGRVQGLFEFIPTITGLEQGLFLPSLTILHGLRDNKTGIEFAFGPTFGISKFSKGYYVEGEWKRSNEWNDSLPNTNDIFTRIDSRGDVQLTAGFLFGAGFSIKSGDLNIPVNAFVVMQKKSFRAGISFGFNAKGVK
ncbi:hypothetical protein N9544_00780 [Flavobacteriales bacterium]|nr:hypothetical protein [Flavobacteriales bacterium]